MSNSQDFYPLNENIIVLNSDTQANINNCGFIAKRGFKNTGETKYMHRGTIENNGYNCLHLDSGSDVNDYYKDMIIKIDNGLAQGSTRIIESYVADGKKILLDKDLDKPVTNGDIFTIYNEMYVGVLFDEPQDEFMFVTLQDKADNPGTHSFKNVHCNKGTFNSHVTSLSYSSLSDVKLKKNIQPLNYQKSNNIVNNLQGVSFEWDKSSNPQLSKNFKEGKQIGFIAQDVEKVLPNLVNKDKNNNKSVEYDKMVPLLIEVIKGLSKRVDELEKQMNGDK